MYKIITDVEEAKVLWPLNVLYSRWKNTKEWSLWPCEKERYTPEQLWQQEHFKSLDIAALEEDEEEDDEGVSQTVESTQCDLSAKHDHRSGADEQ